VSAYIVSLVFIFKKVSKFKLEYFILASLGEIVAMLLLGRMAAIYLTTGLLFKIYPNRDKIYCAGQKFNKCYGAFFARNGENAVTILHAYDNDKIKKNKKNISKHIVKDTFDKNELFRKILDSSDGTWFIKHFRLRKTTSVACKRSKKK
jgi:hypothetical protein